MGNFFGSFTGCVLTTKARAVMNVVPPKLKQPFAAELMEATKNGSSGNNL